MVEQLFTAAGEEGIGRKGSNCCSLRKVRAREKSMKGEGRKGKMEEKAGARSEAIRNEQGKMMSREGRLEAEGGRAEV